MAEPWLLGVLGLLLGSFIATLVTRWPQGQSVSAGRSQCENCGRTLQPIELVPVLGHLLARGRCPGCSEAIGPGRLVIEVAAGAIGALAGWAAPGVVGGAGAVFGWLLLTLAALDLAEQWLPDRLTAVLAATGLGSALLLDEPILADRVIGGTAGFVSLWLVAWAYRRLRGREGLGGGDPKLFGAIGLWLGWQVLPFVLLGASLVGLAAIFMLRFAGQRLGMNDRVPLGTMLAVAAWLVWLAKPQ